MGKSLVIRYFSNKFVLCDGKAPKGCENDGKLYVGNIVEWFDTWEEANQMRKKNYKTLSKSGRCCNCPYASGLEITTEDCEWCAKTGLTKDILDAYRLNSQPGA